MNTIIFVSFGSGPHRHQLTHAILSARSFLTATAADRRHYQIVVYTDDPATMRGLDVKVQTLTPAILAEWRGPHHFLYRPKVLGIRHALSNFGGKVIYFDADTYLLGHPRRLFDRIRQGQALMYTPEASPSSLGISELCDVLREHEFRMLDGRRWDISEHTRISNAGVVGLHEADLPLVDETLHLVDQMCAHVNYFGTEQFAFSGCLSTLTRLQHASDLVHHYWYPVSRDVFQTHLTRAFEDPAFTSFDDRYRYLRRVRARVLDRPESRWGRAYASVWTMAKRMHILGPLKRTLSMVRRNVPHLYAFHLFELTGGLL